VSAAGPVTAVAAAAARPAAVLRTQSVRADSRRASVIGRHTMIGRLVATGEQPAGMIPGRPGLDRLARNWTI